MFTIVYNHNVLNFTELIQQLRHRVYIFAEYNIKFANGYCQQVHTHNDSSKMKARATTDNVDILFAKILKARRLECGFTQLQLATESSLDLDSVSLLERGLMEPSLETVFQLAKAMNIKVSDFVDDIVKLQNKEH